MRYLSFIIFIVIPLLMKAQVNISAMEYYIDTDPGVGLATDVPIATSAAIDVNFNVPGSALSVGFHTLVIRTQDLNNIWSVQESRVFYVGQSNLTTTANVSVVEYYIDTDPGYGAGITLPIVVGATIDLDAVIPTNALPIGFHQLHIRSQDSDGVWSNMESRTFYIIASDITTQATVAAIEYYIDTDPGYGAGTAIAISAATSIDINTIIPTNTLPVGFHSLHIRALDSDGVWSEVESRSFFIDDLFGSGNGQLNVVEYYIDTDPGIGGGTQIPIAPALASIDLNTTIPTNGFADGSYTLGMRVGDTNGNYSITETASFVICSGATADFSATTVCLGSVTDLTDLSTSTLAGDIYSWDFDGDGTEDDATVGNTSFTYSSAGTFMATLLIDQSGCPNTKTISVVVESLPTSNAGVDQTISVDNTVLAATSANTGETGTWSIISGTGVISDVNSPTATLTGITTLTNQLRWTVTNNLAGCSVSDDVNISANLLSAETDILTLELVNLSSTSTIDVNLHTVNTVVARGTDLTSLTPTITVSNGATVSPSGAQNFSSSVIYTVTAEDATVQDWTVTVVEALNTETSILNFVLTQQTGNAIINATDNTIAIEVVLGTDLSSIEPTITLSEGATISPFGAQDFTSTVMYTVTAEDGVTVQNWMTTVTEKPLGFDDVGRIKVYPNPTEEKFYISGIDGSYSVSLVDLVGREIELGEYNSEISLESYAPGVYLLTIEKTGHKKISIRVIKKK